MTNRYHLVLLLVAGAFRNIECSVSLSRASEKICPQGVTSTCPEHFKMRWLKDLSSEGTRTCAWVCDCEFDNKPGCGCQLGAKRNVGLSTHFHSTANGLLSMADRMAALKQMKKTYVNIYQKVRSKFVVSAEKACKPGHSGKHQGRNTIGIPENARSQFAVPPGHVPVLRTKFRDTQARKFVWLIYLFADQIRKESGLCPKNTLKQVGSPAQVSPYNWRQGGFITDDAGRARGVLGLYGTLDTYDCVRLHPEAFGLTEAEFKEIEGMRRGRSYCAYMQEGDRYRKGCGKSRKKQPRETPAQAAKRDAELQVHSGGMDDPFLCNTYTVNKLTKRCKTKACQKKTKDYVTGAMAFFMPQGERLFDGIHMIQRYEACKAIDAITLKDVTLHRVQSKPQREWSKRYARGGKSWNYDDAIKKWNARIEMTWNAIRQAQQPNSSFKQRCAKELSRDQERISKFRRGGGTGKVWQLRNKICNVILPVADSAMRKVFGSWRFKFGKQYIINNNKKQGIQSKTPKYTKKTRGSHRIHRPTKQSKSRTTNNRKKSRGSHRIHRPTKRSRSKAANYRKRSRGRRRPTRRSKSKAAKYRKRSRGRHRPTKRSKSKAARGRHRMHRPTKQTKSKTRSRGRHRMYRPNRRSKSKAAKYRKRSQLVAQLARTMARKPQPKTTRLLTKDFERICLQLDRGTLSRRQAARALRQAKQRLEPKADAEKR